MKDITLLPYLYESQEFQTFIRPPGNSLEGAVKSLPLMTTDDILLRYRTIIPVNESAGDFKLKEYKNIIDEFVKDCRELQIILKFFKKQIKTIVPLKEQEL
jgi:hypothetical protein